MNSRNTGGRARAALFAFVLALLAGTTQAKPHECGRTCTKDGECETCNIVLCEKQKQKDGTMGDVKVGKKTVTTCIVEEGTAATPTALRYQLAQLSAEPGKSDTPKQGHATAILRERTTTTAQLNKKPKRQTKTGRSIFRDKASQSTGYYEAAIAPSDRLNIRPGQISVPRRFDSWESFAGFAEKNLRATAYRDAAGNLTGVGGRYQWSAGDVPARKDRPDTLPDIVSRMLGGTQKQLVIGNQTISFSPAGNNTTSFSPFSTTREDCEGRHCIEGKTWVTHLVFYHSVGTRTRQTAGGTDLIPRPCCASGELIRENGTWMCRGRRPGAWEYDRQAGRLVPTGPNPFVMTEAKTCQRESLRNQLQVRGAFINNSVTPPEVVNIDSNTREVEIGEWLLSLGLNTSNYEISDINGICGIHTSNRGESVRTSEGYTGDDDSLCP